MALFSVVATVWMALQANQAQTNQAKAPVKQVLLGGERTQSLSESKEAVFYFGPIYVLDDLRKASAPVFLHIEGISAPANSEAEVYLMSQSVKGLGEHNHLATLSAQGSEGELPRHLTLELTPRARETLRGVHSLGVTMVVKRGAVRVEQFVFTTEAPTQGR